jgi:hypothetical protein
VEDNITTDLREVELGGGGHRLDQSGCCECGNEPLGSIKCREFFDKMTW